MLYVPLSSGRVLSVAAPCKVASGFAATRRAAPRRLTRRAVACTRSRTPLPCCAATGGCWRASSTGGAGQPHRRPARAHEPVHRHLLGDGRRPSCRCTSSTSAASRRWPSASSTASTRARPRSSASPAASSATASGATRRSRRPATGSRRSASSLLAAVGTALSAIGAIVLIDRVGQGHPHGPARRDDLAVHARARPRHRLRRAPRAGHDRGDDRPAARLRRCWRSRRSPSTRSSSSASASRSSGWASSCCSCSPSGAPTAPRRRRAAPSLRGGRRAARACRATARC